jgi:hypothetical protein
MLSSPSTTLPHEIAIQSEIARGASEDQAVAAVKLQQYEKMPNFAAQRKQCGGCSRI